MNTVIYGPSTTPGQIAVSYALMEVGVKEDPPGSNRGPRVDVYLRAAGLDPAEGSYPWCASFVTWAVREACLRVDLLNFRGSPQVHHLAEQNEALWLPEPIDACVFCHFDDENKGHAGFVLQACSVSPGDFLTVEGNTDEAGGRTGGQVMQKRRPRSYFDKLIEVR